MCPSDNTDPGFEVNYTEPSCRLSDSKNLRVEIGWETCSPLFFVFFCFPDLSLLFGLVLQVGLVFQFWFCCWVGFRLLLNVLGDVPTGASLLGLFSNFVSSFGLVFQMLLYVWVGCPTFAPFCAWRLQLNQGTNQWHQRFSYVLEGGPPLKLDQEKGWELRLPVWSVCLKIDSFC